MYTPSPRKRTARIPPAQSCISTYTRHSILQDLYTIIYQEESNTEWLFRAFDFTEGSIPAPAAEPTVPAQSQVKPKTLASSSTSVQNFVDCAPESPLPSPKIMHRSSENPFLSTPMRLKHFPGLSPTILRGLLRSPSIRMPTPDGSVELSDLGGESQLQTETLASSNTFPVYPPSQPARSEVDDATKSLSYYPLTPPLTGRLPQWSKFHALDDQHSQTIADSSGIQQTSEEDLDPGTEISLPAGPVSSNYTPESSLMIGQCNMSVTDNRAQLADYSLDVSAIGIDDANLDAFSVPDAAFIRDCGSRECGPLEQEFATLLLQRATSEDNDAEELRRLAKRLERLAQGRRALAEMMQFNRYSRSVPSMDT